MGKYIDKDALVVDIERRIKQFVNENNTLLKNSDNAKELRSRIIMCKEILSLIDTLEVKEVDLNKEIDNIWNPRFNLGWNEESLLSMNHEGFTTIAKHFFELGLKAQKGE